MTKFERLFVWLAGAAFVGSLAVCAGMFAFTWGDAGPASSISWRAVFINLALFSAFAGHHSIFAREPVKVWLSKTVPDRLLRSVYVWTASLLLLAVLAAWQPIGGELYSASGPAGIVHALLQLSGLALIVRSVSVIDGLELAGIRRNERSSALHISGPYRLVRHPLYLGWMLIVFGAAHLTGDRFVFALITTFYLFIAMPWEERSLERAFGIAYTQYKARVRWRVIPFVY
jgi:hypothetical protein